MTSSNYAAATIAAVILSFCFSNLGQAAAPDSLPIHADTQTDLNRDGVTDQYDLEFMRARFFTRDATADLNGDGQVSFADLGILRHAITGDTAVRGAGTDTIVVDGPSYVEPGDIFQIRLQGDFTAVPVLGGGFNLDWDASVLNALDVQVIANNSDPAFTSLGVIDNIAGTITGIAFGDFNGYDSSVDIAIVTFVANTATGMTTINVGPNTIPAGPLVDLSGVPVAVAYTALSVTVEESIPTQPLPGNIDRFDFTDRVGWDAPAPFDEKPTVELCPDGVSQCLRNHSSGDVGNPPATQYIFNTDRRWTGNYAAVDVTGVGVTVYNEGPNPVFMRVGVSNLSTCYVSTDAKELNVGVSQRLSFSLVAADMTRATFGGGCGGVATLEEVLQDVMHLRIYTAETVTWSPGLIEANMFFDNIQMLSDSLVHRVDGAVTSCSASCDSFAAFADMAEVTGYLVTDMAAMSRTSGLDQFKHFQFSVFNPAAPEVPYDGNNATTANPLPLDETVMALRETATPPQGATTTQLQTDIGANVVNGVLMFDMLAQDLANNDAVAVIENQLGVTNMKICLFYDSSGCVPGATEVLVADLNLTINYNRSPQACSVVSIGDAVPGAGNITVLGELPRELGFTQEEMEFVFWPPISVQTDDGNGGQILVRPGSDPVLYLQDGDVLLPLLNAAVTNLLNASMGFYDTVWLTGTLDLNDSGTAIFAEYIPGGTAGPASPLWAVRTGDVTTATGFVAGTIFSDMGRLQAIQPAGVTNSAQMLNFAIMDEPGNGQVEAVMQFDVTEDGTETGQSVRYRAGEVISGIGTIEAFGNMDFASPNVFAGAEGSHLLIVRGSQNTAMVQTDSIAPGFDLLLAEGDLVPGAPSGVYTGLINAHVRTNASGDWTALVSATNPLRDVLVINGDVMIEEGVTTNLGSTELSGPVEWIGRPLMNNRGEVLTIAEFFDGQHTVKAAILFQSNPFGGEFNVLVAALEGLTKIDGVVVTDLADNAMSPNGHLIGFRVGGSDPNRRGVDADMDGVVVVNRDLGDTDLDGVTDDVDNCTEVPNPNQRDTNGDGYGNMCDADLDNNGIVNFGDLGILKTVFFTSSTDADFNGDGIVNFTDLGSMKDSFFGPPGPSGVSTDQTGYGEACRSATSFPGMSHGDKRPQIRLNDVIERQ